MDTRQSRNHRQSNHRQSGYGRSNHGQSNHGQSNHGRSNHGRSNQHGSPNPRSVAAGGLYPARRTRRARGRHARRSPTLLSSLAHTAAAWLEAIAGPDSRTATTRARAAAAHARAAVNHGRTATTRARAEVKRRPRHAARTRREPLLARLRLNSSQFTAAAGVAIVILSVYLVRQGVMTPSSVPFGPENLAASEEGGLGADTAGDLSGAGGTGTSGEGALPATNAATYPAGDASQSPPAGDSDASGPGAGGSAGSTSGSAAGAASGPGAGGSTGSATGSGQAGSGGSPGDGSTAGPAQTTSGSETGSEAVPEAGSEAGSETGSETVPVIEDEGTGQATSWKDAPKSRGEALAALRPPASGKVVRGFGFYWSTIFEDWRYHMGLDIALETGDQVKAALGGMVTDVEGTPSSGWRVEVSHGFGLKTVYSHLGAALVSVGQEVGRGEPVGMAGQPGTLENDLGVHLHFEIRVNDAAIDPNPYVAP